MTVALTDAKSAAAASARAAPRDSSFDDAASDEALIRRIAAKDQLAMRTLFARYRIPLYRWLLRIVRDETAAEDLLSDVFLDVWRQAASLKVRASVSTWLLAIARYKALSARRARSNAELDARITATVPDPADDPEASLQKKNRTQVLRDSLASLSPEHGEVIDLVYYHGKSVKEVADIIGVGEATVKTRMLCAQEAGQPGRGCLTAWSKAVFARHRCCVGALRYGQKALREIPASVVDTDCESALTCRRELQWPRRKQNPIGSRVAIPLRSKPQLRR